MKLKELSSNNRPRERLAWNNPAYLSDQELLAIILEKGSKNNNVLELSGKVLAEGYDGLKRKTLKELEEIEGIGFSKACKIISLLELSKRVNSTKKLKEVSKPSDVYEYYKYKLKDLEQEHFYTLSLNTKNEVISEDIVAIGTNNMVVLHPREVFKPAIRNSANSIILVHNHPSKNPAPSDEDRQITAQLVKAGELLNIQVLDHIVIGEGFDSAY